MFEGSVSDQLHQFISSRTSLPLPLSYSLTTTFSPFDSYSNSSHHLPCVQSSILQVSDLSKNGGKEEELLVPLKLVDHRQRSVNDNESSWSSEEVLSLLRIRSIMETWSPEFTWEHVSRKLAEMGFKRSAEKCKEKFEEESRYLNDINFCKNYRFLSELEEDLCQPQTNPQIDEKNKKPEKPTKPSDREEEILKTGQILEENSARNAEEERLEMEEFFKNKKRKKEKKFEVFKVYCEDIVKKMMVQLEEMHNKLLEDMVKRNEEKIAKEEAWKREEMEKMNKELEIMAHEQALAGYRQALIIGFLKQFTETPMENQCLNEENKEKPKIASSSLVQPENPKNVQKDSPSKNDSVAPNPSSLHSADFSNLHTCPDNLNPDHSITARSKSPNSNKKEPALGNRWPKDEVLALINMRCSLYNNGDEKEAAKAPLWERISQGMTEMGYKRSSRRCKEKWENINKYFRKTRDSNRKRSLDSKTCPYFDLLNSLYSRHGRSLEAPPENLSSSSENPVVSSLSISTDSSMHADDQAEKNIASAPPDCYFEF